MLCFLLCSALDTYHLVAAMVQANAGSRHTGVYIIQMFYTYICVISPVCGANIRAVCKITKRGGKSMLID